MRNDVGAFKSWLNAYRQAWENRDPEAAAALFTESGTYQVTPFLEPICGRKAIFEYWSEVARTEENIKFGYEILVASPQLHIARWSASFVILPAELQTQLDGIFLISLDEEGRCKSLQEWWHKLQK
jgi:SnoaL-like domain